VIRRQHSRPHQPPDAGLALAPGDVVKFHFVG